jgi:hypothetical protein
LAYLKLTSSERTPPGDRKSVKQEAYMAHASVQADGLAACCICDEEYPRRPAFVMLAKIMEDFQAKHPNWRQINDVDFNLQVILARYTIFIDVFFHLLF